MLYLIIFFLCFLKNWKSEKTSLQKELEVEKIARTTLEKKYDKDVKHYKFLIK